MPQLVALIVATYLVVTFGLWKIVLFTVGIVALILLLAVVFAGSTSSPAPKKPHPRSRNSKQMRTATPQEAGLGITFGRIRTGLVIDDPWISKIRNGEKTWEMRATGTRKRERIALIKKGSLNIVALATISEVLGPFDDAQILDSFDKHRVPVHMIGKWRYAWVLTDVMKLDSPIGYLHRAGAVIFVTLDAAASVAASAADGRAG